MIRIRRCAPKGLLRRSRYEIESLDDRGDVLWRRETTMPVTTIDRYTGVAEAWALVHAADTAWDLRTGEWISLPEN